jgi:hypothetical protein
MLTFQLDYDDPKQVTALAEFNALVQWRHEIVKNPKNAQIEALIQQNGGRASTTQLTAHGLHSQAWSLVNLRRLIVRYDVYGSGVHEFTLPRG